MAKRTKDEIEDLLGPAEDLIISPENLELVREWLICKGHEPLHVKSLKSVQLANMYHEQGPTDKELSRSKTPAIQPSIPDLVTTVSRAAFAFLEHAKLPGFNIDLQRQIATETAMSAEMLSVYEAAAARAARTVYDSLPPRQIQVNSPAGSIVVNGPLHHMTETILRIVSIGHPVMLVGPAGCGKTTIGQHVANALALPFYITSTINDTHELTGFIDGHGKYHSTPFRAAFEFGGVWVADEIDAWDASALLAANAALANGFAVFPDADAPITRHPNFRMVATANTFGTGADRVYIGRNELDAASLDRFAVVSVTYDVQLEKLFCGGNVQWLERVWKVRKSVEMQNIRHVVSSRAISMGAAALAAGLEWSQVETIYLFKGMSAADKKRCER